MRYCGKCGAKVNDSAIFCTECGNRLENTESSYEHMNYNADFQHQDIHYKEQNSTVIIAVVAGFISIAILAIFVYFTAYRPSVEKKLNYSNPEQYISSTVQPKKDMNDIPAKSITPDINDILNGYVNTLENFLPIENVLPRDLLYGLYDIDKNGIPELIIKDHYSESQSTYNIYSYNDKNVSYIGSYDAIHSSIYNYDGNGFVYFSGMNGSGVIRLFSIKNGSLSIIKSVDVNPQNHYQPSDIFPGADLMIELHSYNNSPDSYRSNIYRDLELYIDE